MRQMLVVGVFVGLMAGGQAAAQDCTPQAHPERWWEIGRFYAHPDGRVLEVLAEVCMGYDTIVIRPDYVQRICAGRELAIRAVRGAVSEFTYRPRKVVVYKAGDQLLYATRFVPFPSEIGEWALVPQGCDTPSAVVSVVNDILQVRVP